ncbi:MAG: glycosyltransferase family 39 protein [Candidatus Aenigmarchaeota archaeon]|nr:glycosyltransferase family 39 protein [Candidatus Aenigmarchaeota archaeon]
MEFKSNLNELKRYFIKLFPLLIVFIFVVNVVYYTISTLERKTIEQGLINTEAYFIGINFLLIIFFFVKSFKDIKILFKKIKTKTWLILLLIFIIGFSLRMFITPHTMRVFFDEDIYLDIAKEIIVRQDAGLCNYGDQNGCYDPTFMKWPNGHPFLLAISYLFFGSSQETGFGTGAFLGSLGIIIVFLIAYLFSEKEKIGLYSALVFALLPVHIMWSGTAASEPTFIFFILLTLLTFLMAFKSKTNSWNLYFLSVMCLTYAIQIRSEGGILLPIFGLFMILFDEKLKARLLNRKFIFAWSLMLILLTPYIIHTIHAGQTDTWGSSGKKFGFEYTKRNVPENLHFWLKGYETLENPFWFTLFALTGLIYLLVKDRKICIFLGISFLVFFMLYGFFYAGSVRFGADVRYSLTGYPWYVILAGYGLYFIHNLLEKTLKNEWLVLGLLFVLIFVIFYFNSKYITQEIGEIQEAKHARAYHNFAVETVEALPKNCYIMSHTPSMFLIMDYPSLQLWNGQNEKVMTEVFNKTDCVVFDDNYWCNIEPYKNSVCKHMFDSFKLEEIDHVEFDNRNYTMYYVYRNEINP